MRTILTSILLIFVCYAHAQRNTVSEEDRYNFKVTKELTKRSKKLKKFKFSRAVKKFGNPYDMDRKKATSDILPLFFSEEMIKQHFPENVDQLNDLYFLETTWKMFSQSWITVWYKQEKNDWIPINILVDR